MNRTEFIDYLRDEMSECCSIPLTVKKKRIDRLIDNGIKYFQDQYDGAVQTEYILLDNSLFQTKEFKSCRHVQLPKCVEAIWGVNEMGGRYGSLVNTDYSFEKYIFAEAYAYNGGDFIYRITQQYYVDFMQNFILKTFAFDFNRNTGRLFIEGRDPQASVILKAEVHIQEEALFEDSKFQRYMTGKVMETFGRIHGVFEYNLLGGVKINVDGIREDGKELIDEVKEEIKDERAADFYLMD